jgi:hypothetical protein
LTVSVTQSGTGGGNQTQDDQTNTSSNNTNIGNAGPVSYPAGTVQGLEEQKCTVQSDVSGFVFVDKNNNGQKDIDEEGVSGINIRIYYFNNKNQNIDVTKQITDNQGVFKVKLCPGNYKVEINKSNIPADFTLNGSDTKDLSVLENKALDNFNFILNLVTTNAGFNWWIVIIILLILIFAGTGIYLLNKKNKEEDRQ